MNTTDITYSQTYEYMAMASHFHKPIEEIAKEVNKESPNYYIVGTEGYWVGPEQELLDIVWEKLESGYYTNLWKADVLNNLTELGLKDWLNLNIKTYGWVHVLGEGEVYNIIDKNIYVIKDLED